MIREGVLLIPILNIYDIKFFYSLRKKQKI